MKPDISDPVGKPIRITTFVDAYQQNPNPVLHQEIEYRVNLNLRIRDSVHENRHGIDYGHGVQAQNYRSSYLWIRPNTG